MYIHTFLNLKRVRCQDRVPIVKTILFAEKLSKMHVVVINFKHQSSEFLTFKISRF